MSIAGSLVTASAVSVLFLPCAVPQQDDVARWGPACGEQVEWHWTGQQTHELVSVSLRTREGSEFGGAAVLELSPATTDLLELRVADRIVARDERAPRQLERFGMHARRSTCTA